MSTTGLILVFRKAVRKKFNQKWAEKKKWTEDIN